MKKSKILVVILLLVCLSTVFSNIVGAEELIPDMRWYHTSINSSGKKCCNILINWDYVDHTNWRNHVEDAMDIWNSYSDQRVNIRSAAYYTESNIDLYDYGSDDNAVWPYADCLAFTTIEDRYSRDYNGGMTPNSCDVSDFSKKANGEPDNKIYSAYIIFNPNWDTGISSNSSKNNSAMNLRKTIVHEIGHCINLAHPNASNTSDKSVMRQGWDLNYSDYDRPQAKDVRDLRTYYTQNEYK
ncbi:MAG: hypothetical protein E7388_02885 [Ruminococcaceae bacterium]|nr:hypothetical protein [Oscillospiraceae bacterium]